MSSDSIDESQQSVSKVDKTRKAHKKSQEIEKLAEARAEIIVNNNYERAQTILDSLISQHARFQKAYILYGLIWKERGDYQKAIYHYTIAAKIKTSPKLWKKIASLEKQLAQKMEKEKIQSEAIFYHYYQAAKYLGKLLRQRNKTPNTQLMNERVDCLEKCYEYEKGIKQLKILVEIAKSLKKQDLHHESIKRMARLFVKKNQLEDAKLILKSIPLNDKSVVMICEILERENNFSEMREFLDNYFGSKTMTSILQNHSYKLIFFYLQCLQQSFTNYQQIVDYYLTQSSDYHLACRALIDLVDKLQNNSQTELLQVLYNYRDQFNQQIKSDILTKYNNHNQDIQLIIEEPQIPQQPDTKDQILFLYKKLKQTNNIQEKYDYLKKILSQEEKSFNKLRYFDGIKREEYEQLFGKKHKKRRLRKFHTINQLRQKTTSLSKEIGYKEFFNIILNVLESLLENNRSQELFKLTYNIYQLRLKKIANNDNNAANEFIQKLAQYGLWASLKERKYRYAPIFLRYFQEDKLILFLIQIIDQNIQPKLRGIFNSFTRGLPIFQQSVIPYKLNQLLKLREDEPNNPLYNLLISVKYLQEMTGRLAQQQEDLFKKSLYYFDCYKDCQKDELEVKYNLARIYLHVNLVNKGMEILEEILQEESNHPVIGHAGFAMMQLHKKLGNMEQAFYYLNKYNTFD